MAPLWPAVLPPGVLGTLERRNPPHTTVVDPLFFAEHGDFGFKLMDSRVFRVAVLDQSFAPREHRNANDANDIEQYSLANLEKRLMFGWFRTGERVRTPRRLLEDAFIAEASKVLAENDNLLQRVVFGEEC